MTKKLLFVTDPLKGLKPAKDTSIFMMEEAIALGYDAVSYTHLRAHET